MVFVLWSSPTHIPAKCRCAIKKSNRITPAYFTCCVTNGATISQLLITVSITILTHDSRAFIFATVTFLLAHLVSAIPSYFHHLDHVRACSISNQDLCCSTYLKIIHMSFILQQTQTLVWDLEFSNSLNLNLPHKTMEHPTLTPPPSSIERKI